MNFLVEERRTLGLLLGEPGAGKSQLLEIFVRGLGRVARQPALVNVGTIDVGQFLWLLAGQLGIELKAQASPFLACRAVTAHLVANRYQEIATILLLDDADMARGDVIDQIVRLAQLDASADAQLTIVLAAQPQRLGRLGERLLELADLRIDLEGWEADDTAAFVKRALAEAGRTSAVFSEAALVRLHELAGGIPRRVKQLADLALLAGAGGNLTQIEADTIETVYRELGVVMPTDPLAAVLRG